MKRKFFLTRLFLILLAANINVCFAQTDTTTNFLDPSNTNKVVTINAEVNYLRHYLWRSILFGSNDVSQPAINIGYKGFYINLACNLNLIPKNLPKEFYSKNVFYDEQDIEIGYSNTFKKLECKVRAMAYYYFNQIGSPSTKELSISLTHPIYKKLNGFTEWVADINAYKGSVYNNTGISYEFTKGKNDFGIKSSVGFGNNNFNAAYFDVDKSAVFYWGNQLELTHNFKSFYCRFSAESNRYTHKEIKESAGQNNTSNFSITVGKDVSIKIK